MDDFNSLQHATETRIEERFATEKPLKRKKSLPRLFLLARQKSITKSKHTQPVPTSANDESLAALKFNKNIESLSVKINGYSTTKAQAQNTLESEVLKEVDRNITRGEYSPPDMLDIRRTRQRSNTVHNFSRNYVASTTPSSIDEYSPLSKNPLRSGRPSDPSDPSPSLHVQQSYSDLRPSREASTSVNLVTPSRNQFSQRPYTAANSTFPERPKEDSQHTHPLLSSARQPNYDNNKQRRSPMPEQWNQWNGAHTRGDVRESMKSGLSTGSSLLDSGSTKHSSIFTKMSSISDTTVDLDEDGEGKDGMILDDFIDLYSARSEDEFDRLDEDPTKSPGDSGVERRSFHTIEANNDHVSPRLLPPRSLAADKPTSAAIVSGDVFKSLFPKPPSIQQPTSTHDQYGYRKYSRDISLTEHDTWHSDYSKIQSRRTSKWIGLLQDQGLPTRSPTRFPPPSAKVQRFVRKGIPPAWRGEAWFFYAGGNELLLKNPDHYADLILRSQTSALSHADKESIERDLHRTFPDNIHFKPDTPQTPSSETPMVSALRRVLCAFAIDHKRIGYCQSLNFLAGLLLLFLPEEKAYWMLHIITTSYLPGTHELSLEGANVDLWVLMLLLKDALPGVWGLVGGEVSTNTTRLPPISLCTTSWFMSLFIGTLPIESVLRVWDVLFYEGSKTLFRIALAVFKLGENEIKSVSDPMEIFQVVQGLPRKMLAIGALMDVACGRGAVGKRWIERKRQERKEWYARERKVEQARRESRDAGRKASDARAANHVAVEVDIEEAMPEPEIIPTRSRSRSRSNARWPWGGATKTRTQ